MESRVWSSLFLILLWRLAALYATVPRPYTFPSESHCIRIGSDPFWDLLKYACAYHRGALLVYLASGYQRSHCSIASQPAAHLCFLFMLTTALQQENTPTAVTEAHGVSNGFTSLADSWLVHRIELGRDP